MTFDKSLFKNYSRGATISKIYWISPHEVWQIENVLDAISQKICCYAFDWVAENTNEK